MPDAQCARSLACEMEEAHKHSHHGHTGYVRHSPRDGFTVSFVLFPGTGLSCPRRQRIVIRRLDVSVGASSARFPKFVHRWYPRLRDASSAERGRFELMPMGIHWPELDEDLGVAGMLKGRPAS